ncbi:uncharacterized protein MYCFIDRAFT_181959 [Pseudocercospora fijiensis CIRAD86]|uniref:Major facilitator superfamily (MFS) profile domain-containing protein n=1 Tax=Pseudocercospora fijiensis (strain CIRAD86) TaxID=383855 RepID=M3BAW6_PSEFD|nr:uncharacterized protein MYCFIDRAFT_181959 [Pseudocercospora fijiensis CIRAD86]EME86452.1 hypothetical protein MYCFIDRAFT_181959 [Pseudocercospora fijiensis CIRAD86]
MYLMMPILFTLLDRGRWSVFRRSVAITGILLSTIAFLLSSFSTQLWHLIILQGVLAALGNTMLYSPTTLYLDEHFKAGRATAYGAILSSKNIVGTACPLLFSTLLNRVGFRWSLRIWSLIVLTTGIIGIGVMPRQSSTSAVRRSPQKVPWSFLKHKTFYIYSIANVTFSAGYGTPQTYLSSYARDTLHLSRISSALMITLFNIPGIISCVGFGLLSDRAGISATVNTLISAAGTSLTALLLWGLASNRIEAVLVLFALCCGFFAGGYSSTWGGWIKEFEKEAAEHNEALNTGMLYGMLNGARGVGYVVSGLADVELLRAGPVQDSRRWGYGTEYGSLIVFTGLSAIVGGWSVVFRGWSKAKRCWMTLH